MLDFSSDFTNVIDNTETVTLHRIGGVEDHTIVGALRRKADIRATPGAAGRVLHADVHWHLPADQLPDPPLLGDAIVDSNNQSWTIIEIQPPAITGRWLCRTRNLAIAAGLDQLVDIHRAAWSKDAHGAPQATYSEVASGVAAHVQHVESRQTLTADRRCLRTAVRIFLSAPQDIALDDLMIDATDTTYRVTRVHPPTEVASPLILDAVQETAT